jgi:prolipoprotein diacylglyceryl transferase
MLTMILLSPLLSITWDINPEIITLEFFGIVLPITWYGLLFASGFLVGQQILLYIFRKEGKPISDVERLTVYGVLATIIGARLGHFLFYEWELLFDTPLKWFITMVMPPFAGLASHGATISIPLALFLYSRKKPDQSFFWVVDRVVIPVSLAGAFIRLGNLFNSEIYGKSTALPWGFLFLQETDPDLLLIVPRHPTQLYESIFCLCLLGLTFYLWKYKRKVLPEGFITAIFIILLFGFRFLVEFLKNNQADFEKSMSLNMGQILSIPAILVGIIVIITARQYNHAHSTPISLAKRE